MIDQHEIARVFTKFFNGQTNIMTPDVLRYGSKRQYVYEVSQGRGIFGEIIFGLTVLKLTKHAGIQHRHALSNCFRSLNDVHEAITNLREKMTV